MSDNITPLHPQKEKRRRRAKRIAYLLGTVVLILITLTVILFHQELNLDGIRRYITYLNVGETGTYGEYSFDAHSSNAYRAFSDGLAVASVSGMTVYNSSGEELETVSCAMTVPTLSTGKNLVLAYDVGGTALCAVRAKSGTVLDIKAPRPIFDADISSGDQIAYTYAADGYKSAVTVFDAEQKEIFQWLSSSLYMPLCAVSDGGKLLATIGLGQTNGTFESSLHIFQTAKEEAGTVVPLGNQLMLDLDFVSAKRICAVGESSMIFLDTEGEIIGEYTYESNNVKDFVLDGNDFAALTMNLYQAGSRYAVATLDFDGNTIASKYFSEEILSISAAGNYLAVLSNSALQIFTSDLTLYAQTTEVTGASRVVMRADGSAILIGSSSANLYLP